MTHSSPPKVALLGRPNVGKSTLFNRLIRSNRAITHDRPGVTRDRMEGRVIRGEDHFILIDTGGVTLDGKNAPTEGPEESRGFEAAILEQAELAVNEAALILLVVDGREGLTPFDSRLAEYLRKHNKPMILVVNKVDGPEKEALLTADFHALGMELLACSSAHGRGIRELEGEILDRLVYREEEEAQAPIPEILLEGAGKRLKKRLTAMYRAKAEPENSVLEEEETVVSEPEAPAPESETLMVEPEASAPESEVHSPEADLDEAAVDWGVMEAEGCCEDPPYEDDADFPPLDVEGETADVAPEPDNSPLRLALLGRPNAGKSSLVNALIGNNRMMVSDIAGTTRDSVDVTTEIDGRSVTFVDTAGVRRRSKITDTVERYSVNSSIKSTTKADVTLLVLDGEEGLTTQDKRLIELLDERKTSFMVLVNKCDLIDPKRRKEAEKAYREALNFCPHVPLLMVSAKKGRNLRDIVPTAAEIRRECGVRIGTGKLNRALETILTRHQPPLVKGARPKFFYMTQAESEPPTFVFFVSDADRISRSYARFMERSLRKLCGIVRAPMRVHFRSSHKKKGRE
jgi:GTP-binding protein